MPIPTRQALHQAEEHLLRAEAEMARAAEILALAPGNGDPRLSQLADVVSTHSHLVGHLATIASSTLHATVSREPGRRRPVV